MRHMVHQPWFTGYRLKTSFYLFYQLIPHIWCSHLTYLYLEFYKSFYYIECTSFMRDNIGKNITKYDMCVIACQAYLRVMPWMNIFAGLKKTGIYPVLEKVFPSESLEKKSHWKNFKRSKEEKSLRISFYQLKYRSLQKRIAHVSASVWGPSYQS